MIGKTPVSVNIEELISIYCDLHNLLHQIDPTEFEKKILRKEAKQELNKRLAFTKSKLVDAINKALHQKSGLPFEQSIFKADYDEIIKKLLGDKRR